MDVKLGWKFDLTSRRLHLWQKLKLNTCVHYELKQKVEHPNLLLTKCIRNKSMHCECASLVWSLIWHTAAHRIFVCKQNPDCVWIGTAEKRKQIQSSRFAYILCLSWVFMIFNCAISYILNLTYWEKETIEIVLQYVFVYQSWLYLIKSRTNSLRSFSWLTLTVLQSTFTTTFPDKLIKIANTSSLFPSFSMALLPTSRLWANVAFYCALNSLFESCS